MSQAESLHTINLSALRALPFVRNDRDPAPSHLPKSFWAARPTASGPSDVHGWNADVATGRGYAMDALRATRETKFEGVLDAIVHDMKGRRDGVTVGFFLQLGKIMAIVDRISQ
jgi:hypothetical protein